MTGEDVQRDGAGAGEWLLERWPSLLEASVPGVFAAGDVRRGSVKRVTTAMGEGATVVQLVHQQLAELQGDAERALTPQGGG